MKRFAYNLTALLLTLSVALFAAQFAHAQPCTIQGLDNLNFDGVYCSDGTITLPDLTFQGLPSMPNPGILWGVYSDDPLNTDPSKDPNAAAFAFTLLSDSDGNPVVGGGTADISQAGLFNNDQDSVCITIVPYISDDIAEGTFNSSCTGILVGFDYPSICIYNTGFPDGPCWNCDANAGTLNPLSEGNADVCAGTIFSTTIVGNNTAADFISLVLIVNSAGIITDMAADTFSVSVPGVYTVYSINYSVTNATTVAAAIAEGQNISNIQNLIANEGICADLDNGQTITIISQNDPDCNCLANVGEITPFNITECFSDGLTLTFSTNGAATDGYSTYYIWTDLTTYSLSATSADFTPTTAGNYYYGVLSIATEDIGLLSPLPATLDDLNAVLSTAGACFTVNGEVHTATVLPADSPDCAEPCLADVGTISPDNITECFSDDLTLTFSTNGAAGAGYTNYYVWADMDLNFTLSATSADFTPTAPGDYYYAILSIANEDIALLSPLPATFDTLIEGILLPAGACFAVNEEPHIATILPADSPDCAEPCLADAGTLTVLDNSVCPTQNIEVSISGNNTDGFTTYYVLTTVDGEILSVNDNTTINSSELAAMDYEIFAINIPTADADLALFNTAIDVFELNIMLGNITCTDSGNAQTFTVLPADSPDCAEPCEPSVGMLPIIELPICTAALPAFITTIGNSDGYTTYYLIGTDNDGDGTMDDVLQINTTGELNQAVGIYLIQALNIHNDFISSIIAAPTTYSLLIANLFEACYLTSAPVQVSIDDCFVCEAFLGDITYPTGVDTLVCENTEAVPITLVGENTTANYSTLYIIVNQDGTVIGSSSVPNINFTAMGLPLGSYTVYAVNYHNQHETAIMSFVAAQQPWDFFIVITGGDACIDVSESSVTYTVVAAGSGNCLLPLAVDNIVETVADDLLTYTVCFTISGGSGNYLVDGMSIVGDTYCAADIPCGTDYAFNVTDMVAAGNILVQGTAPCARPCLGNPGVMPNLGGNVLVCAGESTNYETSGYVLGDGDALAYVLHSNDDTTLGNIYAVNSSAGVFSAATPGISTNTVYYLSAVVGLADGNGTINWDDACTSITAGIPVVFLNPISIETDGICDFNTGEYTITAFVSGGVPAFVPSETYTLSGSINATLNPGQSVSNTFAVGSNNYTIIATDGTCTNSLNETFECVKGDAVEWLSFDGEVLPEGNKLSWKTGTENNSDVFIVERSNNGQNFEYVGKVKAAGNSLTVRSYSFLDKNALTGVNYYRLVERDLNGTDELSSIITLVRHENRFAFQSISPIPAYDQVDIAYAAINDGMAQVAIYNATGALIEKRHETMQTGSNTVTVNVMNYAPGIYFVRLNNGKQIISERFIVNR
jgi:hypothetical protein